MGINDILSHMHLVPAFVPVADAFASGIVTEAVNLSNYKRATLVVLTGAIEDAGISNIVTIEACTAAAGTNNTAIPFRWRASRYSTTVDSWSALAAVAAAGYNFASNNAVANAVWFAEVTAAEVAAGFAGATFVRAAIAETANKTITAAGLWILSEPRFEGSLPLTAIV